MGQGPQEGVVEVALTCVSGGTVEIYIEPQLAEPQLIVIGHQSTAESLATIGKTAGFKVTVLGHGITSEQFPDADVLIDELDYTDLQFSPQTAVVVTSHGNYDEESLQIALQSDAGYVALIASEKRAQEVHAYLRGAGVSEEDLARLRSPAGIDLGGHTPGEIALSVVAEIVRLRHQSSAEAAADSSASMQTVEEALDPVCGMTVDIATSTLMTTHQGHAYHFCSASCKHRFEQHPETYLVEG
jgi:xanthine dehydrogenase accessory factor